jgi:ATP-dependent DNA helicase RecG
MQSRFRVGEELILSGRVHYRGQLQILSPEFEVLGGADNLLNTGRIVPIYALSEHLTQRTMRRILHDCLERYAGDAPEVLGAVLREELRLCPTGEALRNIHFPGSTEALEAARRRLVFDEFFLMQLAIMLKKKQLAETPGAAKRGGAGTLLRSFLHALPFTLTGAQEKVLAEIRADMESERPMNRLLQGDVGSGKTVVAVMAMLVALDAGYQCVLMAPTEILAEQHYRTIASLLGRLPVKLHLLIGEMSPEEKAAVQDAVRTEGPAIVVGTHAVIQSGVAFSRLGLVVVDEQHKFGVAQRAHLAAKGKSPDVLVMTATPIPRTLALTIYGDLDVSVLDEMPPGRGTVTTHWVPPEKIEDAYTFIRDKALTGVQAYIVYPLIEESEKLPLGAATEMAERLAREHLPGVSVGLIHGRMPREEREAVMAGFRQGCVQVLVATSVIEVGLDVPKACIMLVEHAERFGLSQLHQMRGRIGRGRGRSYFFFSGQPTTEEGRKRLEALSGTTDGFRIAEIDLMIRGPGEFFSGRQHGGPDLKIGDICRDEKILTLARCAAERVATEDRWLKADEHKVLKEQMLKKYRGRFLLGVTG